MQASHGARGDPQPPVTLETVVALRKDLVCTEVDGEVLIIDAANRRYHSAGATGSRIIELFGEGRRAADIVAVLIGMYNIDRETCVDEVLAFLRTLGEKELLSSGECG